jgi:YbbR domain-containing protein
MLDLLRRFGANLVAHPHYKLLAVLLALGAWWYVQASEASQSRERVPVAWVMPPDLVSAEALPNSVVVVLEGSRNALRRIEEESLELPVDLTEISSGVGEYNVDLTAQDLTGLPPTVQVAEILPASLRVTLDEEDVRTLTVQPVVQGAPAEGYMVAGTTMEPAEVEVRGPSRALANLTTVDTEPIDVSGLRHNRRVETRLSLPEGVKVQGIATVEARVKVESQVESKVFSEVPIYVRGQRGWAVEPATVRVALEGPAASLRQIGERDVVAQIYLPDEPARPTYTVRFDAEDGPRAEVTLAIDAVEVTEVEPNEIQVVRR